MSYNREDDSEGKFARSTGRLLLQNCLEPRIFEVDGGLCLLDPAVLAVSYCRFTFCLIARSTRIAAVQLLVHDGGLYGA